jgi:hypothetical protein
MCKHEIFNINEYFNQIIIYSMNKVVGSFGNVIAVIFLILATWFIARSVFKTDKFPIRSASSGAEPIIATEKENKPVD